MSISKATADYMRSRFASRTRSAALPHGPELHLVQEIDNTDNMETIRTTTAEHGAESGSHELRKHRRIGSAIFRTVWLARSCMTCRSAGKALDFQNRRYGCRRNWQTVDR